MDQDLASIQQARALVHRAHEAQQRFKDTSQEDVDRIVAAMVEAGVAQAEPLARLAHEETGFGRIESKIAKNLFATRTLAERMRGMKTAGIIRRDRDLWEIATPMGVVAALIPSTNPTSTAMYKSIIAAKARCAVVMSPHPRAKRCTAEALRVVAEAAYQAGAPEGLFACMTEVSLEGTDALLEHPEVDVILATGGGPMVRAAYSKGKPAYGVGSGNVPVFVDRSADIDKAAADILYGTSFDWGTLCSTERTVVADLPIKARLVEALRAQGGYFLNDDEKLKLRAVVLHKGHLNVEQVGQPPHKIAAMAGFRVPESTRALIAEVQEVGKGEPLSMETLSPILSFYMEDGWQAGCERCMEVLHFGGIGHTLGLHCTNERVIEQFALEKPSMRIVVNTVAALGSVGYTTALFPAMTLGPGTLGGSITSDNISPLHLLNIKRLAFETHPVSEISDAARVGRNEMEERKGEGRRQPVKDGRSPAAGSWMEKIEARLLARAGNPSGTHREVPPDHPVAPSPKQPSPPPPATGLALSDSEIDRIIQRFKRR